MAGADIDPRFSIYRDLHHDQLQEQEERNRASARLILSLLFECFRPKSILDVGCGIGSWLAVAQEQGIGDILGLDGEWLDNSLSQVRPAHVRKVDLEKPFDLKRRFDLVISLEVAEHLSPAAADGFVGSLTRHSDVVLFSAAIPFQGGHHHVNEQFPEYWNELFGRRGYVPIDFLRPMIWNCSDVLPWLRQNLLIFAREALTQGKAVFSGKAAAGPLALVHPELYVEKVEQVNALRNEYNHLIELLASGKTLTGARNADGSVSVNIGEAEGK
jgi:SAM-dependent methyltransferase